MAASQALAALDPEFDWDAELWETLTHELRHHLESLADDDQLVGVDYVMDEGFRRADGDDFDPWYYQHGDPVGPGVYQAEEHVFIEQVWTDAAFRKADEIEFEWRGRRWRIPRPSTLGDIHYVWIDGVDLAGGSLQLVLARKRNWRQMLKALVDRPDPELEMWGVRSRGAAGDRAVSDAAPPLPKAYADRFAADSAWRGRFVAMAAEARERGLDPFAPEEFARLAESRAALRLLLAGDEDAEVRTQVAALLFQAWHLQRHGESVHRVAPDEVTSLIEDAPAPDWTLPAQPGAGFVWLPPETFEVPGAEEGPRLWMDGFYWTRAGGVWSCSSR